jgi:adenylate cyclase
VGEIERTFVFVDLAGFTALTEIHGDRDAAETVDVFVGIVRDSLGPADRLVKTIGDAVMLTSPDPRSGVELTARIIEATHRERHFPQTRAGLHHGTAVERDDDYVGAAVNLAARVTAQAAADQTLCTTEIAAAARADGVEVIDRGPFQLRNIADPVNLFELRLCPGMQGTVVDPVCRARIDRDEAQGRLRFEAVDHWFCSLSCASLFASHPEQFSPAADG